MAFACPVGAWVLYSPYQAAFDGEGYFLNGAGVRWTSPDSFDLSKPVFRWTRDADAFGGEGLGGGITWAMHPDFCDDVIPAFREERFFFNTVQFMTCDTLRHAIDVAFQTWSSNHQLINFKDVTDECAVPGAIDTEGHCRFAEVTIAAQEMEGPLNDAAAFVRFDTVSVRLSPTTTAGDVVVGGLGARRAQIRFATSLCWYLDATFCSMFHALSKINSNFVAYVRILTFGCFGVALMSVLLTCSNVVTSAFGHASVYAMVHKLWCRSAAERAHANLRERHSTNMQWRSLLEYLTKMPVLGLLFSLFWTIFTPVFYITVFMPCVECYGFSGALAHEAGHLLGFQHPDVYESMNLRASDGVKMNASTCHRALDNVELRPLAEGTDTFMRSIAAHRPTTCLTTDDLEGLNFLYPTCGENTVHTPICTKPLRLTGYLRLLIAVFLPYSIVTLVVLGILAYVRCRQREHIAKLRENVQRRSQQGAWLRAGMRATWAGPKKTPKEASRRPGMLRRSLTRAVLPGMGGEMLVKALFSRGASRRAVPTKKVASVTSRPPTPPPSTRPPARPPTPPPIGNAAKSVSAPRRSVSRRPLGNRPSSPTPTPPKPKQKPHTSTVQRDGPPRKKNNANCPALEVVTEVDERVSLAGLTNSAGDVSAPTVGRCGCPPVARAQLTTAVETRSPKASEGSSASSSSVAPPLASQAPPIARRPPPGIKATSSSSTPEAVTIATTATTVTPRTRGRHPPSEDRSHPPKATRQHRPPPIKLDSVTAPDSADLRYVGRVAV